jgi:hypothetical protein
MSTIPAAGKNYGLGWKSKYTHTQEHPPDFDLSRFDEFELGAVTTVYFPKTSMIRMSVV